MTAKAACPALDVAPFHLLPGFIVTISVLELHLLLTRPARILEAGTFLNIFVLHYHLISHNNGLGRSRQRR